jgi:hypothetical protein
MSYKALSWASEIKLRWPEKIALMMLANRADPKSNLCFPSISKLAEDCGMSQAQARKAVVNLEKLGLVKREKQIKSYGQSSNIFILAVGATPTPIECPPTPIECHKRLPLNRSTNILRFRARG